MKTVFTSERIRFTEVSESLIADYLVMVNDFEHVNRYIGGKEKSFTEEDERVWVRKKKAENAIVYSMLEKETGRFIGNIELMHPDGTEAELGIALTAAMQNSGFGTEAVRALTAYGFEKLGLSRIFLRTSPENLRAAHVYEKCGFREFRRDGEHVWMELRRSK